MPIFSLHQQWPQSTVHNYYTCNKTTLISATQERQDGAHYAYFGANDKFTVASVNAAGTSKESEPIYIRSLGFSAPPELARPPYYDGEKLNVKWNLPRADGEIRPEKRELIITKYNVVFREGECGTNGTVVYDRSFGAQTTEADIISTSLIGGNLYCVSVAATNMVGRGFETATGKEVYALGVPSTVTALQVKPLLGKSTICISWQNPTDLGMGPNVTLPTGLERRLLLNYTVTISEQELVLDSNNFLNESGTNIEFSVIDGAITSITLERYLLRKGTRYYVAVRAKNDAGHGHPVFESSCAIFPPDPPSNVVGLVSGNLKVNISWSNPLDSGEGVARNNCSYDDVQRYIIQASNNNQFAPLFIFNGSNLLFSSPSRPWFEVSSLLTKNRVTYYRVFAENEAGTSVASDWVAVRSATKASTPTGTATRVLSSNSITIQMSPPEDTGFGDSTFEILGYRIQFSRSGVFTSSEIEQQAITYTNGSATYQAIHLFRGVMYSIRTAAITLAGEGHWSIPVRERSVGLPSAPRSPTVQVSDHLSLNFLWTVPSDLGLAFGINYPLSHYEVEVSSQASFSELAFTNRQVPAMHQVTASEAAEPVTVAYTSEGLFLAMNGGVSIGHIDSVQPIINDSIPCDCKTICVKNTAMNLVCTVVNSALCAQVSSGLGSVANRACNVATVTGPANLVSLSLDITQLSSGLSLIKGLVYFFRARAINHVGESVYSEPVSQRAIARPSEPLNVKGVSDFQGILLSWEPPLETGIGGTAQPLLSYIIRYSSSNFSSFNTTSVDSTRQSMSIPSADLRQGVTYSFEVIAQNVATFSIPSSRANTFFIGPAGEPRELKLTWPDAPTTKAHLTWKLPHDVGVGVNGGAYNISLFFQVHTSRSKDFEDFEVDFQSNTKYNFAANSATVAYEKTGLLRGVTYFFRVLCITEVGFGKISEVVEGVSADTAPQVIAILPSTVSSIGKSALKVVVERWPGPTTINASMCQVQFEGFVLQSVNECYIDYDNSGVKQTVFMFHSPLLNGGPARRIKGTLKIHGNVLEPKFAVTFLQAAVPSVMSITSSYGVIKGYSSNTWEGITAGSSLTIAVVGFPVLQPLSVEMDAGGIVVELPHITSVMSSAVDHPSFLHVTIPSTFAHLLARLNISEPKSGARVSITLVLPSPLQMQVVEVVPSFGTSGQQFSIVLKNAGDLNLANATFGNLLATCAPSTQDSATLQCIAPDLTGLFGTLSVKVASENGFTIQPWRVLHRVMVSSLEFDTLSAPKFSSAADTSVIYESQTLQMATFSVRVDMIANVNSHNEVSVTLRDSSGTLVSPDQTRIIHMTGSEIGVEIGLKPVYPGTRGILGNILENALQAEVYDLLVKVGGMQYVRNRVLRVLPGSPCQTIVSPSSGPIDKAFLVTVTASFPPLSPSQRLPFPFPTMQLEAYMGANRIPTSSTLSTQTSTSVVFRVPSGQAGKVAFIRADGENGLETCGFVIEQAPPETCPSAVKWISSSTAASAGGSQVEVHLAGFPYVENPGDVTISLDFGVASPTQLVPTSLKWSAQTTVLSFDVPRVRIGFADVIISMVGNVLCQTSIVMEFQDDTIASARILSPTFGAYVSAPVEMELEISGMPEVSSEADLHVKMDRTPMTIISFTTSSLPASTRSASGRLLAAPFSIKVRADMTNAIPGQAMIVVTSLKGRVLKAFALLDMRRVPTDSYLRSIQPTELPTTGGIVSLELGNFSHISNMSRLSAVLLRSNAPEQALQIVSGSVRTSLVDLILSVVVPDLSSAGSSDIMQISVRHGDGAGSLYFARIDANITLVDQKRAQIIRVWPTKGDMRGGTRVVMEIRNFAEVSMSDEITVRSPQGLTRALRLEHTDKSILIEFETLPLEASQWHYHANVTKGTTLQISPFGNLDDVSAPRFAFEYLPSEPSLEFVVPMHTSLSGGQVLIMSISSVPITVQVSDLNIMVGALAAPIVGISYQSVDLQGPSTITDDQGVSTATIQFVAPAQQKIGQHTVTLHGLSVPITGRLNYTNLPEPAFIGANPKEGALEGGWQLWLGITGMEAEPFNMSNLRVNVDGIACPVMAIDITDQDPGSFSIRIVAPPHKSGVASLKIFVTAENAARTSRVLAVGSVLYTMVGSLTVDAVHVPVIVPGASEIISLVLKDVWSTSSVSDISVSLSGVACRPLRIVHNGVSDAVLSFEVAKLPTRGMQQGLISLSRINSTTSFASFEVYLKNSFENSASASIRRVTSSSTDASGGSLVSIAIEWAAKMPSTLTSTDLLVSFGDYPAASKKVLGVTQDETELEVVSPASACNGACTVIVTVRLISDPLISASFPFSYQSPQPRVRAVQPKTVSQSGGQKVTVVIENVENVNGATALQIYIDGHTVDRQTTTILSMMGSHATIRFVVPPLTTFGKLTCHIVPIMQQNSTTVFTLQVMPAKEPYVISIWPRTVVAGKPCTIDLVIAHYPIFPIGSFDLNYIDISGPETPVLMVDGLQMPFSLARIVRGGYSKNATSQIRFDVTVPSAGRKTATLFARDSMLLDFQLDVSDVDVATVEMVDPPQGPMAGSVTTIHLSAFHYTLAADIVVVVEGQVAKILQMASSSHLTSITVLMPTVFKAGPASVHVSHNSATPAVVHFYFVYVEPCNIDAVCAAFDLVRKPLSPMDVSLDASGQSCDTSMCINPTKIETPHVEMLSVSQGAEIGGDIVRIVVSGVDGQLGWNNINNVLVMFGNSAADIVNASFSLSATRRTIDIISICPPHLAADEVTGRVMFAGSPVPAAKFRFRYHPTMNGILASVSPSICEPGVTANITVAIHMWRPLGPDEALHIDTNHSNYRVNVPNLITGHIVVSDWTLTKVRFALLCPMIAGPSAFAVVRPSAYAGSLAIKSISFSVTAVFPTIQILSMFPSLGPKEGGTLVLLRVANIHLDSTFLALNQAIEANNETQISQETLTISRLINVSFNLTGSNVAIQLQTVRQDAQKVVQMRFQSPATTNIGLVSFTVGGTSLGVPARHNWKYVDASATGVETVTSRSSSREGGKVIMLSLYGFPALRSRATVDSEGKKYEDEIVVAFGSLQAEIVRIRASEPYPGRTVLEYRVPATTLPGKSLVLIYRSTDPVSSAASYTHVYTDPPTSLDVSRGSTRGGIVVTLTSYNFNVQKETALRVMFGNTTAVLIRDSLVFSNGKTTLSMLVPTQRSASVVDVAIMSRISDQKSQVLFEYFLASQVLSVTPTSGLSTGGTRIHLLISRFPVISSSSQLLVKIGKGMGMAVASELVSSDSERTEIFVTTPLESFLESPLSIPITIMPLVLATLQEREDNQVMFDFSLIQSSAQVVSVSPSEISHLTEQTLIIRVERFKIVTHMSDLTVLFGNVRTLISSIVSSDSESMVIQVKTPALSARKAGYACSVDYGAGGKATSSASFVLNVADTTLLVVSLEGTVGPATGKNELMVELEGMARPHTMDDLVISFGELSLSVFVKAKDLHDDGVTSRVTIIVPEYLGPSEHGRALVQVHIFVRQEPTTAVSFVYTYLTNLRVESAILSADATSINMHFDQSSNLRPLTNQILRQAVGSAEVSGSHCEHILTNDTMTLLGKNPRCYVVSSQHIYILLGHMASILPSSMGTLHSNVGPKNLGASVSTQDIHFTVLGTRGDEPPTSGGIVGPSEIGPCESARFELIMVSLHPPVLVEWTVSTDSVDVFESSEFSKLQELLSKESDLSLTLSPENLQALYVDFILHIRIVTILGKTSKWLHHVSRTEWPIPSVKMTSSLSFSTLQPMQVIAEARASQCLDVATTGLIDKTLKYSWSLTNSSGTQPLTYVGSDIIHAQNSAPPGIRFRQIGVEVFAVSDPISIAKAVVELTFRPAPLVAMISGGDRAVSSDEILLLSAEDSFDRDDSSLVFHYRWSCTGEMAMACRDVEGSLLSLNKTSTLSIPGNSLDHGKIYTFHLTVLSDDGRIATAHSRISMWKGSTDVVTVALTQESRILKCGVDHVKAGTKAVLEATFHGMVPPSVVWSLQWSGENQDEEDVEDLYSEAVNLAHISGQVGSAIAITQANVLAVPTPYIFVAATANGRSWCPVILNSPPSGGACTAVATGNQLLVPVEVRCSGFFDRHSPMTYALGLDVNGSKTFGKPSFDASQTVLLLYGTVHVFVHVTDSEGSSTEVTVLISGVGSGTPPHFDGATVSTMLEVSTTEALVQLNIIHIISSAQITQTPAHETLLQTLMARLLGMVEDAPPSPDIAMRMIQTLLSVSQIPLPVPSLRSSTIDMLFVLLRPSALPARQLSEAESRQCTELISNIYAQETMGYTLLENHRFAVAMEELGETIGKATLGSLAPGDPAIEVTANSLIMTLKKVESGGLKGAELNFPIPDGTTVSIVLPLALPQVLDQLIASDVQMVQHRSLWAAGGEELLSFPVSLSATPANVQSLHRIDFGEEEVFVTLPFNASNLHAADLQRVYRGEGVSCVTWKGDEAGVHVSQPWTARGCRIETIRVALDAAGEEAFGLGSVVCACSHMSTYALSFREESVRFSDPTPEPGDLLVITAGHMLNVAVRAIATTSSGKSQIMLSQLSVSPSTQSFVSSNLSPAIASSALQEQNIAGIQVVHANVSWTPMEAGSFTLSLGLFAGL